MDTNASGLLQLISAAVTPVVMISACAALILGINSKHTALSDRVRSAVAECRLPETSPERRQQLLAQLVVFEKRFRLAWYALTTLYGAVIAFILTTLLIILTQKRLMNLAAAPFWLFLLGVALMLVATCFELTEIALSMRSLRIEMRDIIIATEEKQKSRK